MSERAPKYVAPVVAVAALLGGAAGYGAAETTFHSQAAADAAVESRDAHYDAYLSIAEEGSCEDHVLETTMRIGAVVTPKSADLTTAALDGVCVETQQNYHVELGQKASVEFKAYHDAKLSFHEATSTGDKVETGGILVAAGAAVGGILALLSCGIIDSRTDRKKKNNQTQARARVTKETTL